MLGIDHRHLSQSVLLEETGNPLIIRIVVGFCFFLVFLFVSWANVTHIDEVAMATGEIQPNMKLQQIQNFEGGVVTQILVKEGDFVEKNAVVLRLNTFTYQSELREAESTIESLRAQQSRLRTLLGGQLPKHKNASDSEKGLAIKGQDYSIEANSVIQDLTDKERRLEMKRQTVKKELEMNSELAQKGYVPQVTVLNLQRNLSDVDAEIAEVNGRTVSEYTRTGNDRIKTEEKINRLREQIRNADVRAPATGIIHKLKVNTIGGVISRGDEIMEIVPQDATLEAMIKIKPKDIGHVHVGQQVKVRFTTYDFSRYGKILGELKDLSAAALLDKDGTPYHQGLVKLSQNYVGNTPGKNEIIVGMTVQADIVTGNKTVLEYLLKPIYASAKQVFKER